MSVTLRKVKAVQDDSCHWYVLPIELVDDFYKELSDEFLVDSGLFDERFGKYRTGGDLNNIQLFAEI